VKESAQAKAERERQQQILADFKDKKSRYAEYWDPIYKVVEAHRVFTLKGKQFEDGDWQQMGVTKPLEPNLLLTYANHEANKTLQTDYRGKVTPNGSGASDVMARARQDVLRGLQRTGNINQIFNQVRRNQVAGGIAYSITKIDYAGKRGFGKTIKNEFLEDYQNVYPDIEAKSNTLADMVDCLIKREVAHKDWEAETGEKPDWGNQQKKKELWYYWVREDVRDKEYLLSDGKTALESKLPQVDGKPDWSMVKKGDAGEPLYRPVDEYTWCMYTITDERILSEATWKGSYPPIVACIGRRVVSNGKVEYQPLTQFAEEAQRVYTLIENVIGLRLSRSPFSKWKIALETIDIKGLADLRRAAQVGDYDILYKSLADDGKTVLPAPEEEEPYILDPLLIELQREQQRKMQQIFGIFDANLGQKSNEQSGVAIRERAQGGELSNYDLQFLYMEYVEQVSRVMLDLIPKYLNAQQQIAFVDENDNTTLQWLNTAGGIAFSPDEEYSLSIEAMPISQTSREEEALALKDMAATSPLISENPQAMAIVVKAQPGRYSAQIADVLAGANPEIEQAKAMIADLQGQLAAAEQKSAQDSLAIAGLKQTVSFLKQQQTMLKQMASMEGNTEAARLRLEEAQLALDAQIREAETALKAMDSESKRMTAEASMISAVDKASRPDPKPTEKKGPPA
jgi:hypothetical protein